MYILRFQSLVNSGRGFTFECDKDGVVDVDAMSEQLYNSYVAVWRAVGIDYAMPIVEPTGCPLEVNRV